MDLKNGRTLWSKQLTQNDAYNNACALPIPGNCPETHGADADFGQPPILVSVGSKRLLVIAQKSGMVHAIDPDEKGKIVWQTRAGEGGALGGSQWGSAADGKNIYVAVSDIKLSGVADPKSPQGFRLILDPATGGGIHALDLKSGAIVWESQRFALPGKQNGLLTGAIRRSNRAPRRCLLRFDGWALRAYSTATGHVLWDTSTAQEFDTASGKRAHGGSMDGAGPAVVDGMVFVNSGYGQWGGMPGNVLLAFSVK